MNPQPLVLETRTLPIELLAYIWVGNYNPTLEKLLGLAMLCVLTAARAILIEFHPIGIVTAILFGGVITFLAIITL